MNGQQIANAFTSTVRNGTAPSNVSAMSADSANVEQTMRFRVAGNLLDANLYDQAPFFCVLTPVVIDGDYQLATITPTASRYDNAAISDYIWANPMEVLNVNFPNVAGADPEAATASLAVVTRRFNPFNENAQGTLQLSDKQTAADFQTNRVQTPLGEVLDGYTEMNITNDQQAGTAVSYIAAFLFGGVVDRRLSVTRRGPVIVRSPSSIK